MQLPEDIQILIDGIVACHAYEILCAAGNPSVNFFRNGQLYLVKDIVQEESVHKTLAKEIGPFLFWGGPPNRLRYYRGTLFTLLCDRLLALWNDEGLPAVVTACCCRQPRKIMAGP